MVVGCDILSCDSMEEDPCEVSSPRIHRQLPVIGPSFYLFSMYMPVVEEVRATAGQVQYSTHRPQVGLHSTHL